MKKELACLVLLLAIIVQLSGAYQPAVSTSEASTYIVVLREPAVAQRLLDQLPSLPRSQRLQALKGARARFGGAVAAAQEAWLAQVGRDPVMAGMKVLDRQTLLINSLLVSAGPGQRRALEAHPQVLGVYPNRERSLVMDAAPMLVRAVEAWERVGGSENAGAGIRIGLIDSGINQNHTMLQDPELVAPEGFPISEPDGFANSKVIVARTFVKIEYGMRNQTDKTPRDEIGHGSNVAGAAAGRAVESPLAALSGIAPKAYLGNYKVFGSPTRNSTTTSAAVIAAINAAVEDGMDIINLSLGGPAIRPEQDPEQMTIANASALGYIFTIAAGNNGPGTGSLTSPGTSPAAITVGAATNARTFGGAMELSSNSESFPSELETILAVSGNGTGVEESVGPLPLSTIVALDSSQLACVSLPPDSLQGRVALVKRGECNFSVKVQNLDSTGAIGLVVYNDVDGSPIAMDFGSQRPDYPAVMVTKAAGEELVQFLDDSLPAGSEGVTVEVTFLTDDDLRPFPTTPDVLAGFSGRGPSIDRAIKPDLTAPGVAIHTASNGSGFTLAANGTSFATPMVAGAAALLLQHDPESSTKRIKSALVNSAVPTIQVNGNPALANEGGNGRLDVERAFQVRAFLDPVSISFGNIPDASLSRRTLLMTSFADTPEHYSVSSQIRIGEQMVELSVSPQTVDLAPAQSRTITLDAVPFGVETHGSFEGTLTLTPENEDVAVLRLVFWGTLVANSIDTWTVSQSNGAAFGSLEEAFAKAGPGDTIEIIDSSIYSAPGAVELNASGTRLNDVTLRGAEGQRPVIQTLEGGTALAINNLRMRLENLDIRGGEAGVLARFCAIQVVNCRVETLGQPSDQNGAIQLEKSRAILLGGELLGGAGNGLASFDSDVLLQDVLIGSEEEGSAVHGLFASPGSTLAIFDSAVLGSGASSTAQGLRLSSTKALLKGVRVESSRGSLGDGVQALGESQVDVIDSFILNNTRAGISSFNGAVSTIRGSRIDSNEYAGVLSQQASLHLHSSVLTQNGVGAAGETGQLEVRDSVIAASLQDGIKSTDGQLTVLNTTVVGNEGSGINNSATPAVIANSILVQNADGDYLDDGSASLVTFNLVSDPILAGQNNNFSGDPSFKDPLSFDFALTSNSDAVDRGTDSVEISETDLAAHQRVVDGNVDGQIRVDVGALEYASPTTEPLLFPVLTGGDTQFTGLALANGLSPAAVPPNQVWIRAYESDGVPRGEALLELNGLTQDAFLVEEKFPDLSEGWLEILSSEKDLSSFGLAGDSALTWMDGSTLSRVQGTTLYFPEIRSREGASTTVFLVNPNSEAQLVRLWWHENGEEPLPIEEREIAGRGSARIRLDDLPGGISGGYLRATAARPLFGLELFGDEEATGGLLALSDESSGPDLFGAQLASGPEVETNVHIINLGGDEVEVTLQVKNEGGETMASIVRSLGPGEDLAGPVRELFELPAAEIDGWLAVHSSGGQCAGSVSFQDPGGRFLAALPLQVQGAREFFLSQVAQTQDIFTGVTVLNASDGPALVIVEVFTAGGTRSGLSLMDLEPDGKVAFLLSDAFPDLGEQKDGFIRVRSNQELFGFELFGRNDLEFLSAVPQQIVVQ